MYIINYSRSRLCLLIHQCRYCIIIYVRTSIKYFKALKLFSPTALVIFITNMLKLTWSGRKQFCYIFIRWFLTYINKSPKLLLFKFFTSICWKISYTGSKIFFLKFLYLSIEFTVDIDPKIVNVWSILFSWVKQSFSLKIRFWSDGYTPKLIHC